MSACGELDEATAAILTATDEAEINRIRSQEEKPEHDSARIRLRGSVIVGAVVLVTALAGITWATGGARIAPKTDTIPAPDRQVDLVTISNDPSIEGDNAGLPEVNRVRLSLAKRYFQVGQFSDALAWFQKVLDSTPTPAEESEALALIGWMILESGDTDTALRFVTMSLDANPSNLEATFFRGLIYARSGRTAEALTDLRLVGAAPGTPDDIRTQVIEVIAILEQDG